MNNKLVLMAVSAGLLFGITGCSGGETVSLDSILENASDLTTQKLITTDVFENTYGKIPLFTRDKFLVKYKAYVDAGFDIKQASVEKRGQDIVVTIPHCTVQDVNVHAEDIKFYDTNISIFEDKKAAMNAEKKAEEHAEERAPETGLLEAADQNAVNLMKGLFAGQAGNGEVIVEFK